MALVALKRSLGRPIVMRALLDPRSEVSIISTNLARRIGDVPIDTDISISGVEGECVIQSRTKARVQLEPQNNQLSWLKHYQLADPEFYIPREVDVLFGADIYHSLFLPGHAQHGKIIGQSTIFSWTLMERASALNSNSHIACLSLRDDTEPPWHHQLVSILQRF